MRFSTRLSLSARRRECFTWSIFGHAHTYIEEWYAAYVYRRVPRGYRGRGTDVERKRALEQREVEEEREVVGEDAVMFVLVRLVGEEPGWVTGLRFRFFFFFFAFPCECGGAAGPFCDALRKEVNPGAPAVVEPAGGNNRKKRRRTNAEKQGERAEQLSLSLLFWTAHELFRIDDTAPQNPYLPQSPESEKGRNKERRRKFTCM